MAFMKTRLHLLLTALAISTYAADDLPKTLLATRGKLLFSEDFTKPPEPFTGKPVGFASGFLGWRYNAGPGTGKSGRWELRDGTFTGIESPEAHHPATASYGIQFKDAIIQCDVRLNDVPDEGRKYRSLFVKATDVKDYVISLSVGQGGLFLTQYDAERLNPTTKQRDYGPVTRMLTPIKLGEWHTVVLEIKGDEVVGTLDGKSATCSNPLIGVDKQSIMIGAGTEASFRKLRVWEALPNADWPKNKAALPPAATPAPAAK